MTAVYLFDKVSELKEKLKDCLHHHKKVKALENYSEVVPFHHREFLFLIKHCMASGFLGEEESKFLGYMLQTYFSEQNFIDWTFKSKWLKSEMKKLSDEAESKKPVQQDLFDWSKLDEKQTPHIPLEVLIQNQTPQVARRA